jgi:hypothetical protein
MLVCYGEQEANRVRAMYSLDHGQVYSLAEWKNAGSGRGGYPVEVVIDNAERLLEAYVGAQNVLALATFDDPKEEFNDVRPRKRAYTEGSRANPKKAHSERLDNIPEITTGQEQITHVEFYPED